MERYDETLTMVREAQTARRRYTMSQMNANRVTSFIYGSIFGIVVGITFCTVILNSMM